MSYEISVDDAANLVRVTLHGVIRIQEALRILDDLTVDGSFTTNRRLWDLGDCVLDLSPEDLEQIATIGKTRDLPRTKGAILANDDLNFGLSRLHEAYRESENIDVRVCRSEQEALTWLAEDD